MRTNQNTEESNPVPSPILPGATLGILGGGQLGRMIAIEAKKLGYFVGVLDPDEHAPAAQVADFAIVADYENREAITALAQRCAVLTYEFENVAAAPLRDCTAGLCRLHPSPEVLHIAQNREREKTFLAMQGFPCPCFEVVSGPEELEAAARKVGLPAVLKTAAFGYDGKGQQKLVEGFDAQKIWVDFGAQRGVLEAWVDYAAELSVVCARWEDGSVRAFPVVENHHRNHILDMTIAPGRFSETTADAATHLACEVTRALGVVGLLTVEMVLLPDGSLLVNETAPRPHNSGHFSFDACVCSQFEQQVRAVCGLPPGASDLLRPAVMVNLLGDVWREGREPAWQEVLRDPMLKLHLYGKSQPRKGRKMGHFCTLGETVSEALARANEVREILDLPLLSA